MNSAVNHTAAEEFEQLYIRLRQKESRIYTDEEVKLLPLISNDHPHYNEWKIRRNSCKALLSYVKKRQNISSILEVGCGNGWLSAKLSTVADVTGLDINTKELDQAKRVFNRVPNLRFIEGNLQDESLKEERFDMILFAASIQYFPSLEQTMVLATAHLTLQGEIHIMDSPFYLPFETEAARQRTKVYYDSLGFPEMTDYYHHHTINELETCQYKILHHPHSWKNKLSIKKNPFYWIVVKNRYS